MEIAASVAKKLLQINAIQLSPQNPFIWASGLKSPIYCDNRLILSYPEIRQTVVDGFVQLINEQLEFDLIAGVATAGIPHGALVANQLNAPFIYVRSKAKGHGKENLIEGKIPTAGKVVVIEDLISTGGSSLKAVEALRTAGLQVSSVLAIFSYGFPLATEAFSAANCPFQTLSNYDVLLEVARAENYLNEEEFELLKTWREDPKGWSYKLS